MTTSVRWRTSHGAWTALIVERGRKFLHVVTMPQDGHGVRVRRVPLAEEKYMAPLLDAEGRPYDPGLHALRLLDAGERFGISEGTQQRLEALV